MATILKGQRTVKDGEGNIYAINGLVVPKEKGGDLFFSKESAFFKLACAEFISHDAIVTSSGKVNLY